MALNNSFTFIGNLGKDADHRTTPKGTPVVELTVGVSDRKKEGETWVDTTTWIDAVMFGNRADALFNSGALSKGSKVALRGRVAKDTWTTESGDNRSAYKFIVEDVELMSRNGQ